MQKLQALEDALEQAACERSALEKSYQDRFDSHIQEEKDKIVQILEVSFSEREKKALDSLRDQLQLEHKEAVDRCVFVLLWYGKFSMLFLVGQLLLICCQMVYFANKLLTPSVLDTLYTICVL